MRAILIGFAEVLLTLFARMVLRRMRGYNRGYRCRSASRNFGKDRRGYFFALQDYATFALDTFYFATLLTSAEGGRRALLSGATSTADTVDEIVRGLGQIEVNDVGDAVNVDAARGDVRGY